MLRVVAVVAALAVGATAVWAQNAAGIAARKEAMKAFGGAAKGPGGMNKGDAPFELPKVQASLKTIEETATKAKGLFPDDIKTGETDALPAAFEKKADLFAQLRQDGRRRQGRRTAPSRTRPPSRRSGPRSSPTAAAATRNTASPMRVSR